VQVSFEAASVKEDPARTRTEAGPPTMVMHPSGQFAALNVRLRQLILVAYVVRPYQIIGGPDWMGSQFFDIVAAPGDFEMGHTKAMMRGSARRALWSRRPEGNTANVNLLARVARRPPPQAWTLASPTPEVMRSRPQ
jgi:hypothetical protein